MIDAKITFAPPSAFHVDLHQRVDAYFAARGLSASSFAGVAARPSLEKAPWSSYPLVVNSQACWRRSRGCSSRPSMAPSYGFESANAKG